MDGAPTCNTCTLHQNQVNEQENRYQRLSTSHTKLTSKQGTIIAVTIIPFHLILAGVWVDGSTCIDTLSKMYLRPFQVRSVAISSQVMSRLLLMMSLHVQPFSRTQYKAREGKGREGKGREGKGREGKGGEGM